MSDEKDFLDQYDPSAFERPSVTADTVIFSIDAELRSANYRKLEQQKLTVLLLKREAHPHQGRWGLPGSFISLDETLEEAAGRVVRDKTRLQDIYLEQLYTFGAVDRDPRTRVISCAYMALINRADHGGAAAEDENTGWFELDMSADGRELTLLHGDERLIVPVERLEVKNGRLVNSQLQAGDNQLAFDHGQILLEALGRLRGKLDYTDIVFNLMPDEFSIGQLQQVFEIIWGEKLFAAAFRRKIADKIEETGSLVKDKGHRPSRLFRFKHSQG
ncbi:ADP-ribose pyrophosphatase [Deltaproteobacteria bacterium Smac51]|nr:ADP-ribose pyrophosphatase [Deltaproteobacteria bacterium Smac51]